VYIEDCLISCFVQGKYNPVSNKCEIDEDNSTGTLIRQENQQPRRDIKVCLYTFRGFNPG